MVTEGAGGTGGGAGAEEEGMGGVERKVVCLSSISNKNNSTIRNLDEKGCPSPLPKSKAHKGRLTSGRFLAKRSSKGRMPAP